MKSSNGSNRPRQASRFLGSRALAVVLATSASTALYVSAAAAASTPPGASTGGVSNQTSSSVVLQGSVNPQGLPTTYVFQYGPTVGYGAQTSAASAGSGVKALKFSQPVGGLQGATLYHYRILASSAAGTRAGADRVFLTRKIPLSLQISGAPNPVPFGDPFMLQGTLLGTGGSGRVVALQAKPFPYLGGFQPLGNPEVTGTGGGFSFPVVGLLSNTQLRVVTTGPPFVTSPVIVEGVAVRVTFHARRVRRRRRGEFFRMYGTVTPTEVGARVGFQLLRPGLPSQNKGGAFVKSGTPTVSRFSAIVRIRHRGRYQALVQVADGSHVSAYSAAIRIR